MWNYWWAFINTAFFFVLLSLCVLLTLWSVKFSALPPVPRTFNLELLLIPYKLVLLPLPGGTDLTWVQCAVAPLFSWTHLFCRYLLGSVLDADFCQVLWPLFCVFQAWPWWKVVTWKYVGLITILSPRYRTFLQSVQAISFTFLLYVIFTLQLLKCLSMYFMLHLVF